MATQVDPLVPALDQVRQLDELIALRAGQREAELGEPGREDGSRIGQRLASARGAEARVFHVKHCSVQGQA